MSRVIWLFLTVLLLTPCLMGGEAATVELERGYRDLYALRFDDAQRLFEQWCSQFPTDARGPVSQAAGDLFAELHRSGVLEAQFFEKDEAFQSRPKVKPDLQLRTRFYARLDRAQQLAKQRLNITPTDPDALFAITLVHGLRADYTALIQNQYLKALKDTRRAAESAQKLLQVSPTYYDAYLATGVSNYLVGSLFAPLRWLLRLGGYKGDREEGLRHLEITATQGRLLAPFARMLLAIASLRAGDTGRARQILVSLRDQFPTNPLFEKEIARIDTKTSVR
jgi:tetratricopeptide (TPR) repeat protein